MKLVRDWRDVWRYYSTQALLAIAALQVIWVGMPYEVQALLPESWRPWVLVGLALSGVAGRMVKQKDA